MQDQLKEIRSSLPEAVNERLIEEAKFIKATHGLDEAQAALVERALFMGAGIAQKGVQG